jgi:hypothetical protein
MEYDEPAEVVEAEAAEFRDLMTKLALTDPATMCLIAGQLNRSYRSGRSRGKSEGFQNGFAVGVPLT